MLLTSAHGMRGAQDFAQLGFAAYILKPVSHRDLRECLGRIMSMELPRLHERTQPILVAERARDVPNLRILLAEDNLVNQKVARGALEKMGFKVDIVNNGADAIAAWKTDRYHIFLSTARCGNGRIPGSAGNPSSRTGLKAHSDRCAYGRCDEGRCTELPGGRYG